jgi:hypothetical protein
LRIKCWMPNGSGGSGSGSGSGYGGGGSGGNYFDGKSTDAKGQQVGHTSGLSPRQCEVPHTAAHSHARTGIMGDGGMRWRQVDGQAPPSPAGPRTKPCSRRRTCPAASRRSCWGKAAQQATPTPIPPRPSTSDRVVAAAGPHGAILSPHCTHSPSIKALTGPDATHWRGNALARHATLSSTETGR